MVQVVSLGLGRRTHSGEVVGSNSYLSEFALSETTILIGVVGIILTAISCIGCFTFHCCPSWIPMKIRRMRDRFYHSDSKNGGKYQHNNRQRAGGSVQHTIPIVIISDDTGILDPPLYQPNESNKCATAAEDEPEISIPINASSV